MKKVTEDFVEMENVSIADMTIYDISDVLEIEKLSFATPWSRESFENEIERNMCAKYIVARKDGRVVGYAGMWIIIDECHITNVAVHPNYRGMHVGDKIMNQLVAIGKKRSAAYITLEVRKTNFIAQNLYTKYGFEPTGIRPKYYGDNGEDAIIMVKKYF